MTEMEVFRLTDSARSFATRSKGQEMARRFSEIIEGVAAEIIVVAWDGVRAASPSFIDEFVGGIQKTFEGGSYGRRTVVFTGDDGYIVELVDTILRRREFPVRYALRVDDVLEGTSSYLGHPTLPKPVPA